MCQSGYDPDYNFNFKSREKEQEDYSIRLMQKENPKLTRNQAKQIRDNKLTW